jgi:hypothetical protein
MFIFQFAATIFFLMAEKGEWSVGVVE